jgi:ATP-dependent RNA helicase HelY
VTTAEAIDAFTAQYPFPLDDFQVRAIGALESGRSVLVAAPTGTGKTVVADYGVALARRLGMRAIYTAPIKALSNQKFHDWRAVHGNDVGLLTGDVSENPDGRILVMTTEVLRNMLLRRGDALGDTAVVIFDEVHFLADPDRGTTWEEAILSCPAHVRLVCLSATISNAAEIARWIGRVHREVVLVEHPVRSVPIDHLYLHDGALWPLVDADGTRHPPLRVGGELRVPRPAGVPRGARPQEQAHPRDVLGLLGSHGMLPVIWFQFGRRACEVGAAACLQPGPYGTVPMELGGDREAHRRRAERVTATLAVLRPEDRALQQVQDIVRLVSHGVAFHHAGVLPVLKQLVEGLFTDGLLSAVFATETLALGVNMPARSVVVTEHTKYDGTSRRILLPNEYQQLAGRAGRRGMDARGFSVNLYSPWTPCSEVQDLATASLYPVRSAFTARYHTVASLWDGTARGRDRLERLFSLSLRQFQTDDALRAVLDDVEELRTEVRSRHFACPIDGIEDDAVVQYGAIRRDLADTRRQAARGRLTVASAARDAGHLPWTPPAPAMVKRAMAAFTGGEVVHLSDWRAARPSLQEATKTLPNASPEASGERSPADGSHRGRSLASADVAGAGDSAPQTAAPQPTGEPGTMDWAIFLRREGTGPGVFLVGEEVVAVPQWGMVTRLAPPKSTTTRVAVPEALRSARLGMPFDVYDASLRAGVSARLKSFGLPDASRHEAERAARQASLEARLVTPHVARETLLAASMATHSCHACSHRAAHERAWKHEREAQVSLQQAEAAAVTVERLAATQATRILDAIVGVLGEFGVLTPVREGLAAPTDLAAALTAVYDPSGLVLLNAARRGWFDRLNPADLMEVVSWFCFDRDAVRWNRFRLSAVAREVRDRLAELSESLSEAEARADLPPTPGPSLVLEGPVTAWCRGASFAELLEGIGVAEGDLLQVLNKTLDLASQVREGLRIIALGDADESSRAAPRAIGRSRARRTGAAIANPGPVGDSLVARLEEGDRLVRRGLVAESLRLIVDGAGPETTSTDAAVAAGSARVPTDREKPRRRRVAAVRRPRFAVMQEAPVSDNLRPKPRPDATEG